MRAIKKILVGTNHAEASHRAEHRAVIVGSMAEVESIEFMGPDSTSHHLLDGTHSAGNARMMIGPHDLFPASFRRSGKPLHRKKDFVCHRSIGFGKLSRALCQRSMEIAADLIVVASEKEGLLSHLFFQRQMVDLTRVSKRPVLFVKKVPMHSYQRVLIATDFSVESMEAAKVALTIAPDAHITCLHAYQVVGEAMLLDSGISPEIMAGYRTRARDNAAVQLNQFIACLGKNKHLISPAVQYGATVGILKAFAEKLDIDLIAIGKHGRSRFSELFRGGVKRRMISECKCDLLIVPRATPNMHENAKQLVPP